MEMKENIKLKNILLHSINKTKEVNQTIVTINVRVLHDTVNRQNLSNPVGNRRLHYAV